MEKFIKIIFDEFKNFPEKEYENMINLFKQIEDSK